MRPWPAPGRLYLKLRSPRNFTFIPCQVLLFAVCKFCMDSSFIIIPLLMFYSKHIDVLSVFVFVYHVFAWCPQRPEEGT